MARLLYLTLQGLRSLTICGVHSFDVFDTSLVRMLTGPDDLFFLAAKTVLETRGKDARKEDIIELARLKHEAARSARRELERDDVTLREIYRRVDVEAWGITALELMNEEIRLEEETVRPVASIRSTIDSLRRAGQRIVFISDTNIPGTQLRSMLENASIAIGQDGVYASGDLGLTKASGRLFRHVLENEGASAKAWTHHGDHSQSDVEIPRQHKIAVDPFYGASLNRFESILLREGEDEPLVGSTFAGLSRCARLTIDPLNEHLSVLSDLTSGVIAPLLTSFVAWVLREARASGIQRLYFVSRDGDVLLHIVRELAKGMEIPDCRYLYGSRQAWLFPSVQSFQREDLDWILGGSKRLVDLLAKLSLRTTDVGHLLRRHGFDESALGKRLDGGEQERFWELIAHPDIESMVLRRAQEARETTLAYLHQEGLTAPGDWALVDIGWGLRSQWALKKILDTVGHADAVSGFYLAASDRRRPMAETGPFRALFLPEQSETVRALLAHAMLLEEAFVSADHASVAGYGWDNGRVVPVLGERLPDERRSVHLVQIRQVVATYAREALQTGILDRHLDALCRGALRATVEFLTYPTRYEAQAVAWLRASDDPIHDSTTERQLAVRISWRDLAKRLADRNLGRLRSIQRVRNTPARHFWEEGSLALSTPLLRSLYRLASRLTLRTLFLHPVQQVRRRIHLWWQRPKGWIR